jgi:P2 family phage contractile tail tube protein
MALPKILKNFNLFIDGLGMAGLAEEITLPKLELQTEEYEAAGMLGPVELDLGMNALKLEFTLAEFYADVLKYWGIADAGGINARFLGAVVSGDGSSTDAIEVSVRGRWKSLDFGTAKKKELAKLKVEMPLTYFKYSANSDVLVEIDMISGKQVVNGTDLTAAILQALSISA